MVERYAGDISCETAWEVLNDDPGAVLVDVRTDAEWAYVGVPDLRRLGKSPLFVAWQQFPSMAVNPRFVAEVGESGVTPEDTLVLLGRDGSRSAAAAQALTEAGFRRCYNVADGFEGDKDDTGKRGGLNGWKAHGLPWVQS
jgi:rhodanese-related sulfurtransferase